MLSRGVFVDAMLLVLLVVGITDPRLIAKHRRLRTFVPDDYERLAAMVSRPARVLVTPNTLTEASNLLAQHGEPERSQFFDTEVLDRVEQGNRRDQYCGLS